MSRSKQDVIAMNNDISRVLRSTSVVKTCSSKFTPNGEKITLVRWENSWAQPQAAAIIEDNVIVPAESTDPDQLRHDMNLLKNSASFRQTAEAVLALLDDE